MGRRSTSTFKKLSLQASKEFLQTAVVVDDQASMTSSPPPTVLITPVDAAIPARDPAALLEEPRSPGHDTAHSLDAKALTDGFAASGIVCTVLRPEAREDSAKFDRGVVQAARRADVLILDWHIQGDYGGRTIALIRKILIADARTDRLRLIVVYTGNNDLLQIRDELHKRLDH